jgi:hypothetical protein
MRGKKARAIRNRHGVKHVRLARSKDAVVISEKEILVLRFAHKISGKRQWWQRKPKQKTNLRVVK